MGILAKKFRLIALGLASSPPVGLKAQWRALELVSTYSMTVTISASVLSLLVGNLNVNKCHKYG
jgi:hypothetical protein